MITLAIALVLGILVGWVCGKRRAHLEGQDVGRVTVRDRHGREVLITGGIHWGESSNPWRQTWGGQLRHGDRIYEAGSLVFVCEGPS